MQPPAAPVSPEVQPEPTLAHDAGALTSTPAPEQSAAADSQAPQAALGEAPASVNVRLQIAGREVQWTLRDHDEARLAVRLEALLARYPVTQAAPAAEGHPQGQGQLSPQQFNALAQHRPMTGVCPLHQVAMKENHKDGRSWWSHKTPEGQWCKGR